MFSPPSIFYFWALLYSDKSGFPNHKKTSRVGGFYRYFSLSYATKPPDREIIIAIIDEKFDVIDPIIPKGCLKFNSEKHSHDEKIREEEVVFFNKDSSRRVCRMRSE